MPEASGTLGTFLSWSLSAGSAAILLLTLWGGLVLANQITGSLRRQLKRGGRPWWQRFEEKRSSRRIHADELRVSVSDGIHRVEGLLSDLSGHGLCVMGLPDRLLKQADRFAVEISGPGEHYSLHVTPKWQKLQESGRQIGASIECAPENWSDFIRRQSSFIPV